MLNQSFDMLIDRIGDYGTNGYESAHVFGLRGANCIGYIIRPDRGEMAWNSEYHKGNILRPQVPEKRALTCAGSKRQ